MGMGTREAQYQPFADCRVDAESVEDFLSRYYKPERFSGRDAHTPGYSQAIIENRKRDIERHGYAIISRHDSVTGRCVAYFPEKISYLYRGRHKLPHQSQQIRRDLHAERLAEMLGGALHAYRLTPEQVEKRRRGDVPGLGLPYEIIVQEAGAVAFTAFYTVEALAEWAIAYGIRYTLPQPGQSFRLVIPDHTSEFKPLTETNPPPSNAPRVFWMLHVYDGKRPRTFWQCHNSGAGAWNAAQAIVDEEFPGVGNVIRVRPAFDNEVFLLHAAIRVPDGVMEAIELARAHGWKRGGA